MGNDRGVCFSQDVKYFINRYEVTILELKLFFESLNLHKQTSR